VTTQDGQPFNVAYGGSRVGVMGQNVDIDSATFTGNVQLTVSSDAPARVKFRVGAENLKHGNSGEARRLIWDAMISGYGGNEVLFHWLIAMLSGRTVQQFSAEEANQLKRSRSRCAPTDGDAWANGVRLIYRLLDSVLTSTTDKRKMVETDMRLLVKEVDALEATQRDMLQPHLELFLTGPIQDEVWRKQLRIAKDVQHADGRAGRAWMFFQPFPTPASLPAAQPVRVTVGDLFVMWTCACVFALTAGYLGWELLWQGNVLGLLSYVVALTGGTVTVAADLEVRFVAARRRQKDQMFRAPSESALNPRDELSIGVGKLFNRYYTRYVSDKAERQRWDAATAGIRRFHSDEIIGMCRSAGVPANQMAWLVRYEVRELKHHWQHRILHEYWRQPALRPRTVAAYRAGLAVLTFGGVWAVAALRAHPLAIVVALLSVFWTRRCWLRVSLERRRYAADSDERAERQAAIDEEFERWNERLEARPTDAEMASWLTRDRTVLLGMALDHFHLPRSQVIAYAFLELPGVAVKRAQIEGGPWRYGGYRIQAFLLSQDGVHQVRVNLNFGTGTLDDRERTSYPYDSIVAMHFLREARRQTFKLRLADGDPIVIRLRNADLGEVEQDQDVAPTDEIQETDEADDRTTADATSVADLLHMLERAVAKRGNWFQERGQTQAWPGGDAASGQDVQTDHFIR
jgi:hypothetical protein